MKIRFLENQTSDLENDNYNFENIFPNYSLVNFLKSGAKIHIKEKNKGSFTKYCGGEVTNECIQRGKNSSDPAIRKKAVFAQNARAWKHQEGGTIKSLLKTYSNEELLPGVFSVQIPGINLSLIPTSKTISELFVDPEEIEKTKKEKKEKEDINKTLNKLLNSGDMLYQTLHPSLTRQSDKDETISNTTLSTEKDEDDIYPELKVPYKRQFGGNLYIDYKPFEGVDRSLIPSLDNSLVFEDYSTPSEYEQSSTKEKIQEDDFKLPDELRTPYSNRSSSTYSPPKEYKGKRYEVFKHYWDEYVSKDPSAAKYEGILTDIANHESRFNYSIKNTAGAPAYGYFQFWEDNKTKNITHYSGLSVEEFRRNPLAQIAAAVKMARNIENSLTKNDLKMAAQKGYGLASLIRGAWLGGLGGVRQVLKGTGNPSDAKWYHGKSKGRSVKEVMDEQKSTKI